MAIRDIVTRGFGNGTYSPGVNKIPTRGYSIGVVIAPDKPGLEYDSFDSRPHYHVRNKQMHYDTGDSRDHYHLKET